MFAYCGNCPIAYSDILGHSRISSVKEQILNDNDDLVNHDITSHKKRIFQKPNNVRILFANEDLIGKTGTYNELIKETKGTGLEVHHLIEKRFYPALQINGIQLYASTGQMPSVVVTHEEHQIYTNAWRAEFPYGINYYEVPLETIKSFAIEYYGCTLKRDDWIVLLFD